MQNKFTIDKILNAVAPTSDETRNNDTSSNAKSPRLAGENSERTIPDNLDISVQSKGTVHGIGTLKICLQRAHILKDPLPAETESNAKSPRFAGENSERTIPDNLDISVQSKGTVHGIGTLKICLQRAHILKDPLPAETDLMAIIEQVHPHLRSGDCYNRWGSRAESKVSSHSNYTTKFGTVEFQF